jgi:type I restriction enzyme S subunit
MVLVPSKEETEEMGIIMGPIVEKLIKNTKQICTLEQLRDTLLPKLMSGEVRVEV